MSEAFLLAHPVDAQIMYTDVNPDLVIQNSYFNLDLNNDGVVDFGLGNYHFGNGGFTCPYECEFESSNHSIATISAIGQNGVIIESTSSSGYQLVVPFGIGQTINGNWDNGNGFILRSDLNEDFWGCSSSFNSFSLGVGHFGNTDRFIGLRVFSSGNYYYGWARVKLNGGNEIVLKDYAINTQGMPAQAGNTSSCSTNNYSTLPGSAYWLCNDSVNVQFQNPGSLNLQWVQDGNWISGETGYSYTILQPGNYQVLVSDSNCNALVNAINAKKISYSAEVCSIDATCGESNAFIHLTMHGNSPAYNYQWSSGQTDSYIDNIPSGIYQLTITTSICNVSDTLTVNIGDTPHPQTSETHSASVCNNEGTIDLTVTGGNPPYNYNWSNQAQTQDLDSLTSGIYQVVVTDDNGCHTYDTIQIYSLGANITELHTETVCSNNGFIDITTVGGIPPYQFLWSNGSTNEDIANVSGGYFQVTVTDDNGCIDISAWIHINHSAFIPPTIVQQGDSLVVTTIHPSYQWYRTITLLSGETNQFYIPTVTGGYKVLVPDIHDCIGYSNSIILYFNAAEITETENISCILNEEKKLIFHLTDNSLIGNQIEILNQLGQLVTTVTVTNQTPEADLSALPAGIYFYHIRSKQKTYSGKFLIE